jgi:hypothetical protein
MREALKKTSITKQVNLHSLRHAGVYPAGAAIFRGTIILVCSIITFSLESMTGFVARQPVPGIKY